MTKMTVAWYARLRTAIERQDHETVLSIITDNPKLITHYYDNMVPALWLAVEGGAADIVQSMLAIDPIQSRRSALSGKPYFMKRLRKASTKSHRC